MYEVNLILSLNLCLNFKQNTVQSASSASQPEGCFDFIPIQFYVIDLWKCADKIWEVRNLCDIN